MPLHNGFYGTHAYSFKTRAIVGDTATLTLSGGSFTVKASSYEEIETKADANGPAKAGGSSAGVGAGIAVDVTGIDVASIVADGVNIIQKNDAPLTKIEITVAHSGNEMMEAKAGSSGGISISPVVALMISGAYTEARLGSGAKLTAKGDVRVEAQSALVREMAANASAAGGRVGVGGSFNISILNDSAEAYVRRSLKSCNLTVNAVSRSTLKSTSRAGAKGASSGSTAAGSGTGTTTSGGSGDDADDGSSKGESDQQADHLIGGGGKLAGRTGSTNTSAAITNRMNSGRQGAQTSEGSIQIAAAFNLNIMKNRAEASIADGLWVRAEDDGSGQHGTISVTAANNTDATIRANASATNSKIGVGVAVAINIASYHNIASIGKTTVEASKLTVSATMPADLKKTATTVASTGEAINSLDAYVTSGVQALLSQILDAIGLDEETSEAVSKELATVVGDLVGTITRELLSGTGLEQLLSTDIVTKIDKRLGELGEVVTESVKTRMIDFVINQVLSQIAGHFNLKDQSTTPTEPGVMTFSSQVKKELQLIASDVFEGIVDVNQFMNFIKGNWQETLKNNALNAVKKSGKVLTTAALDGLSNWLNLKIKASDIGPTHEFVTQAVSGAGASSVGVAGAAAIAVISGETKAYLADGDASVPVDVTGTLTIFAKGTQVEDTVASSAVGDDGMPDRNKAAGGDSDVGSGSAGSYAGKEVEGSGGKLVIGTTNNGRITSLAKPAADEDTYRIKVKADEGYKLSGLTLTRSDTGATLNVNITGGVFDAATNEWLYTYSLTGDRNAEDPSKYNEVEIGGTPVLAVDVVTHPDNPKVNEFIGRNTNDHETKLDGDHLKWIEDQLLQALLESQTAGELAAWVMERAERGEWTAALAQAVVETLLGAEDETAGLTAGFIAKLLGSERIAALLSEESRSTLAETAKRMNNAALSSVTDANEVAGRISAENRKRIFESLSEEEKLQAGLDPAAGTITAEKLAALLSGGSRLNLAAMKEYLDDAFLAQLALRADQTKAEGAVNAAFAGGADGYRPLISAVAESDAAIPADTREKAPADAGYTVAYEDANKFLAILLGLQMSRAQRMDASGMPALDADGKPIWDEGPACIPALGEYLGSLLTEDDIERLYRQALNASVYPQEDADAGFTDTVPPAFNLHIGVSTGETWLYNDGDINIVQEQGDLTVQNITSERGNVCVGTENGSILAAYTGGTHDGWHILGRDITLAASGEVGTKDAPLKLEQRENSPLIVEGVDEEMYFDSDYIAKVMQGLTDFTPDGTQKRYILRRVEQFNENGEAVLDENGAPALAWILDVVVRYDWIREDYPNPEPRMTLTVVAGGGAYVEELTGSVRGSIKAGGNAAYTVNGGEVGTYTDPLITDVDGTLIITARNDISVKDLGNLDLVANSAKGQINAVAVGDIALKNTNGQSLVIGPVVAGGDAKIIADGALVEGNRYGQEAQVHANNITLQADGEIGTAQNPFDVDTRTGVLSAVGTELVLNEVSGNLTIKSIIATVGNVTITAPGSISEAGGAGKAVEDAAQDQQAANAAMDEADAANAQANVLDAYPWQAGLPQTWKQTTG